MEQINNNNESKTESPSTTCSCNCKKGGFVKKIVILTILTVAIIAILFAKQRKNSAQNNKNPEPVAKFAIREKTLPRLLDLGADKCSACVAMTPILEKLKEEYKGVLQVDFIDVWKNKDAAAKYNIQTIPTQIFFNAKGEEFDRHIGFISKEDILKRFKKLLKRK